ncbi:MAG: 5-bromo-4-chloroindolyl phosphate hydrolysis family protein [Bacillus sp. (in: firmicutes)]
MKYAIAAFVFILNSIVAVLTCTLTLLICWLGFGISFITSIWAGIGAGILAFIGLKWSYNRKVLKESGLSRREFKYIQEHLKEAKGKIGRLQKVMFSVGNVMTIKQNYDVLRVAKKIQSIVENEPRRFYDAEPFYYVHLDSLVELTEKYAFLTKQPVKTKEMRDSLNETRVTLTEMVEMVEQDLFAMLNDDVNDLRVELDIAKQSIDKNKEIKS